MDRPPRDLREHAISGGLLLRSYLWLGALQSLAALGAFFGVYWLAGYQGQFFGLPDSGALYESATTMALATVVATQIGNLFAQRTERVSVFRIGLFSNPLIWVGIATEIVLLLLMVYLPPLQWIFGTAPPPAAAWLIPIGCIPLLLVADEVRKALLRRRTTPLSRSTL